MTGTHQQADSQQSSLPLEVTDLPPTISLQEPFSFSQSPTPINSFGSNQNIEIVFAQGHRLCLQGSFDWETLSSWLTPLLTLEK